MKKIILALVVVFATGCFSSTFKYSNKTPGRTEQVGRTFLIFGLVNSNDPLRAQDLCPEGVQGVETIHTFGNMFLACLTVNIYTPNTVRVTCQSGAAHNFYLNDDEEVVAQQSFDTDGNMVAETVLKRRTLGDMNMKRLIAIMFVFALVASTTGCFHNQIVVDENINPSQASPDFEHGWQIHLIGLVDLSGPVELTQVCPQGAALLEVERTFVNGLVTAIVPLVSFQTRRVYCQTAPTAAALSAAEVNKN